MNYIDYNKKYLKYKQKYMNLKNQFGGELPVITKGTSWYDADHINDFSIYKTAESKTNSNIIKIISFHYKIGKGKFDSYYLMEASGNKYFMSNITITEHKVVLENDIPGKLLELLSQHKTTFHN